MNEKQITLVLPLSHVETILACVGKQPLEAVLGVFLNIKTQTEEQIKHTEE